MSAHDHLDTLREQLQLFADRHGLGETWHEPDQQEISARVVGFKLDNAFGAEGEGGELVVVLMHERKPVLRVNLADLLALACLEPDDVANEEAQAALEIGLDHVRARRSSPVVSDRAEPMQRWVVATWKHENVGGESLVLGMDADAVVFATGPTPWGTGSWGPFPPACVKSTRPLTLADSWPVSGCPSARWTAEDLLAALQRARVGTLRPPSEAEITLTAVVAELRKGLRQGDGGTTP